MVTVKQLMTTLERLTKTDSANHSMFSCVRDIASTFSDSLAGMPTAVHNVKLAGALQQSVVLQNRAALLLKHIP